MRKLIVMCSVVAALAVGRSAYAQAPENPDPPPDDGTECPDGTTDIEGADACTDDENGECEDGFIHVDIAGGICFCESGETDENGACVSGGPNNDDGGNDGCPPGSHPEGSDCVPNDHADDLDLGEDGCPEGYSPSQWGFGSCEKDYGDFCWTLQTCDDPQCPLGWDQQVHTGICFPSCVFADIGHSYECKWQAWPGTWEQGWSSGSRAVVTATDVTFFHYYGWGQPETFELDNSVGNECGPWETLILGNCEALCEIYNVDCPTEEEPWHWIGWPRWPTE